MPKELRNCKVTPSYFSSSGIVLTSRRGAWPHQVAIAAVGVFAAELGLIGIGTGVIGSPLVSFGVFIIGAVFAMGIWNLRRLAPEISILPVSRQILGVSGRKDPISFSEVRTVFILNNNDLWGIVLTLRNGEKIPLVNDYPLNVAIRVATGIGRLLSVPVLGDRGNPVRIDFDSGWTLPYPAPSGRFPLEYLMVAGSLAGSVGIALLIRCGGILSAEIVSKWILLLAIAIPGGLLISRIQENKGFEYASILLTINLLIITLLTFWGLIEPPVTFWGLIPAVISALLAAEAIHERRPLKIRLIVFGAIMFFGLFFALTGSYCYHSFFSMDPSFVERMNFEWEDGRLMQTEYPYQIQHLLQVLQSGDVRRKIMEPQSSRVRFDIIRPAGRNYFMLLHREGKGTRTQAVYDLYCTYFGKGFYLGTLASHGMDTAFQSADSLSGYWPPGY
ncbi:hypothetical protein JW823_04255 [bacterium]|nr:hypothetical protein [candidate division CSSED10-310 bacterium]